MWSLTHLLERYLGVPVDPAGERLDWRLEAHVPGGQWVSAAVMTLAAAFAVYVLFIYWKDAAGSSRSWRILLAALRLTAIALALVCLLQVTLSVGRVGLPVIVIAVDDSASMSLEDRDPADPNNEMADELLRRADLTSKSRLGLAQAILLSDDGRFLRELLRHHTLRLYHFSETAVRLAPRDLSSVDDIPETMRQIRSLKAEGSRTRPGPALRAILEDSRGAPPAAIIMLSDGVASTGDADRLSLAAGQAAESYVPIDPVGLGSEQPARDVQLYDVSAEELAFVGDPYLVTGRIRADGFGPKRAVTVRLVERESHKVLAQASVDLRAAGEALPFELTWLPTEAGELEVAVEAVPLAEETNRENNRETRHVSVRKEKIRVLLADASPRWEFRYLKALFERDPTVHLNTVLQEADADYASEDRTALPHLPLSRDELFRYDVLILGDLNPTLLGGPMMALLRDFVRESGGGLLLIAGPNFNPVAYRGTPLDELVPLDLADVRPAADDSIAVRGFRPELTIDGLRGTGIFRLGETEAATLDVWHGLPALHWLFGSAATKPGTRVFATWRQAGPPARDTSVIAMRPVGTGRVLFHATDELWRWRYRVGDQFFGPFWSRTVRYLSRSHFLGRDRTAELTSDRVTYAQGETPLLRVRFFDERFVPSAAESVAVALERRNGERRSVSLGKAPGQPAIFEGPAAGLPMGTYHAWVEKPSFRDAPPSVDFRIEAGSEELVKRNLDRRELEQTAQISRGVYSTWQQAPELPDQIAPGHPVPLGSREHFPLWNRWELLVVFAATLVAEWILRKRARLL